MAYKKRSSAELDKARRRLSGLESIGNNVDLGNNLNYQVYHEIVEKTNAALSFYNNLLSQADAALSDLSDKEHELADLSERMLNGVGVKYGYDSLEYEKAGGVRKSDKKTPVRKAKKVA